VLPICRSPKAVTAKDSVKGVEAETLDTDNFKVTEQMKSLLAAGGAIKALWNLPEVAAVGGFGSLPDLDNERPPRTGRGVRQGHDLLVPRGRLTRYHPCYPGVFL
jgi:hypothetical protein